MGICASHRGQPFEINTEQEYRDFYQEYEHRFLRSHNYQFLSGYVSATKKPAPDVAVAKPPQSPQMPINTGSAESDFPTYRGRSHSPDLIANKAQYLRESVYKSSRLQESPGRIAADRYIEEILSKPKKRPMGAGLESDPEFSNLKYGNSHARREAMEHSANIGYGGSRITGNRNNY